MKQEVCSETRITSRKSTEQEELTWPVGNEIYNRPEIYYTNNEMNHIAIMFMYACTYVCILSDGVVYLCNLIGLEQCTKSHIALYFIFALRETVQI